MSETKKRVSHEDPISEAWRILGVFLGMAALLALSVPPLLRGEDPLEATWKAAVAFLVLWVLNRVLALAFGFEDSSSEGV